MVWINHIDYQIILILMPLPYFGTEDYSVFYRNMIKKYILITTMERIKNQIINFLNTYENEKTFKQLSERSI
jgi:hypothetical protein